MPEAKEIITVILFFVGLWFARRKTNLEVQNLEDSRLLKWRDEVLQLSDKCLEERRAKNKAEARADQIFEEFEDFKKRCKCQPLVSVTVISPPTAEPKLLGS